MSLISILINLGLEEKEAKTYLTLLSLGESTATKISESSSIDRTLIYQLTNKLIDKGFASYNVKNGARYFSAADPEKLLEYLQEKERSLEKILPELKAKQKSEKEETKVEVFKGKKGIISMMKLVLEDNYYLIGGMHESYENFEIEATAITKDIEKSKVKGKVLVRKKESFYLGKNEEYRYLPENAISSITQLILPPNKTVVFVWSEPYHAILIENEEVAKSNLATFNYLWSIAEKPTKKDIEKHLVK